ncbi:MAG: hypothetical protein ACR2QK_05910, partial [Acidimicrobiales bacterium]
MTEASYTAWDDKQYVWPPPEGWYEASDGKWWPEGYGPPAEAESGTDTDGAASEGDGAGADAGTESAVETAPAETTGEETDTASSATTESSLETGIAAAATDITSEPTIGDDGFAPTGDDAGTFDDVDSAGVVDSIEANIADLSEDGAETAAMTADGSGAFSSAPMEMNDLSSVATDLGTDSMPDINDVMPTQEIGSDALLFGNEPALDEPTGSLPAVESRPDAEDSATSAVGDLSAPDLGELAAPAVDGLSETDLGGLPAPEFGDVSAPDPTAADIAAEVDSQGIDRSAIDGSIDDFSEAATGVGENVTQVVPTDLSAAPTDFVPPPPGPGDDFVAPPGAAPLSPLDRPTGSTSEIAQPPSAEIPAPGPAVAPPPFGTPPTGAPPPGGPDQGSIPGSTPGSAEGTTQGEFGPPPGQFAAPGAEFGTVPPPGQPGFGGAQAPGTAQAYPGGLAPDAGLDSQAILATKPKGGRSKGPILALIGVLALAAIGAALFFAFGGD